MVPLKKSVISAPYNGYIKKIFVKLGDHVEANDPLVTVSQSLQSKDTTYPLRAPFKGTVVQIEKSEGEYVREGDPKDFILRVDNLEHFFVVASAPEIDRIKLKVGQEAVIRVAAILNRTYKGVISELSLAAKEKEQWGRSQSIEYPIKIELLDFDPNIHSGNSVIADIITAKKSQVLTLRHEFIRRENNRYFVLMADGHKQEIQVGMQNEEGFEVVSGLKEGDKVRQVDFSELIKDE